MIKKIKQIIDRQSYLKYFYNTPVNPQYIFLESQHGQNINGNIFYILQELSLNPLYRDYTLFLGIEKSQREKIEKLLHNYRINHVHYVYMGTKEYYIRLSESKYLFNDTSFLTFFIKKDEQVYVNTWHGTPIKTLGKDVKNDNYKIGNIQKNLLEADYILTPSSFVQKKLMNSYMINELYNGTFLLSGYPRNIAFFNLDRRNKLIKELNLMNKQLFAFMPTWRGVVGKVEEEIEKYKELLMEFDSRLKENQCLFINFHPFMSSNISFDEYKHIFPFPNQYETYDFLNIIDCLITDYSSVFFDFVNTGKKIILYNYDEENYIAQRGLYFSLNELPFPKVQNIDELIFEMNRNIDYDIQEFKQIYCQYENESASQNLCQHIILQKKCIIEEKTRKNGKKNILIFGGRMIKNGITTSLMNLLNSMDLQKYNIFISFTARNQAEGLDTISLLPYEVSYYPHFGKMGMTILDFIYMVRYYFRLVGRENSDERMARISKNELYRLYGHTTFDSVVHFRGYVFTTIWQYSQFTCPKSIFVHNDMVQEMKKKKNQHPWTLQYAYQHFDHVAVVSEDIKNSTINISQRSDNVCVCKNIIDKKGIIERGNEFFQIEEQTEMTCQLNELKDLLSSPKYKFVNVGRFSVEKGHYRLIDAFASLHQLYPDTQLIIIGGYGNLFEKTKKYIKKKSLEKDVILIKNVKNPLPIIKSCNGFVLSSFYEGFGLVLAEANILGLPVVSTDIDGPRGFMKKYNGLLVENSEQGIYNGLEKLYQGQVKVIDVDYDKYNQEAIQEFYDLLE